MIIRFGNYLNAKQKKMIARAFEIRSIDSISAMKSQKTGQSLLVYLIGYRSKILVAIEWIFAYFFNKRGTRLIYRDVDKN